MRIDRSHVDRLPDIVNTFVFYRYSDIAIGRHPCGLSLHYLVGESTLPSNCQTYKHIRSIGGQICQNVIQYGVDMLIHHKTCDEFSSFVDRMSRDLTCNCKGSCVTHENWNTVCIVHECTNVIGASADGVIMPKTVGSS